MATNNFKPFAINAGANVTSQADWEALPALSNGFQSGKASSAQVNKALRQGTFMAAALGQFVSDALSEDVLDDGDLPSFVSNLVSALKGSLSGRIASVNFYTASTTHVRGDDVKKYLVILTGAGASGGSQTNSSVYARSGGAGGTRIAFIDASNLSTVPITIGSGGAAVTPSTSIAFEGNAGGDSLFGSLMTAKGGTTNNFGGSSSGSGWAVDGGNGSAGSNSATTVFGGVSFWGGGGIGPLTDATLHDGRAHGSGGAGISSAQARSGKGMNGCCLLVEFA
ncbi:glycine-rich domain-containing protein [Lonsdalea quercina]|uniref:glycine-rich domain-containing protein n=1 Tax=Lonsdalea quercina TaxID=71657 RepID=UPI0039760EC8